VEIGVEETMLGVLPRFLDTLDQGEVLFVCIYIDWYWFECRLQFVIAVFVPLLELPCSKDAM
jgi:hypothetical protein